MAEKVDIIGRTPKLPIEVVSKMLGVLAEMLPDLESRLNCVDYHSSNYMKVFWDFLRDLLEHGRAFCIHKDYNNWGVLDEAIASVQKDGNGDVVYYDTVWCQYYGQYETVYVSLDFCEVNGSTWWRYYAYLPDGQVFVKDYVELPDLIRDVVDRCLADSMLYIWEKGNEQ